jgi:diaminopimelate decarboxylase
MPDPWPRSARWTSAGLEVGGLAAADLADRYGTPLVVIVEADLRERMRAIAALCPRAAYAV